MDERKNISDMSFEEFFSKKDDGVDVPAKTNVEQVHNSTSDQDAERSFVSVGPKLNYKDGSIVLYVPRYHGAESDRFETSIEYHGDVIPTGRLSAGRSHGKRMTYATTIDLGDYKISPFDRFVMSIDGRKVYENRPRRALFFNGTGLPVGKPVGHVIIVCGKDSVIRAVKAETISDRTDGDVRILECDVSFAGQLWVDGPEGNEKSEMTNDVAENVPAESVINQHVENTESAAEKKVEPAVKRPKARKTKIVASIKMPQGVPGAEVMCCGEMLPLYRSMPSLSFEIDGCELEDCVATYVDASDNQIPASDAEGYVCAKLSYGGKNVAKSAFFIIPDFDCEYSGKGDIPDSPIVKYRMFGDEGQLNIYEPGINGPFVHDDVTFMLYWGVPTVTYDIGSGPMAVEPVSMNIDDLVGSFLTVNVTGAKKKKLYFGPEKGKKRDLSPEWVGDKITVDLTSIKKEIFAAGNLDYCFYISVNSFPNRKFLTIRNPVRIKASFKDGNVQAEVASEGMDCVCRFYMMDKSIVDTKLVCGENAVAVNDKVIEAEVIEFHNGAVRNSIPVKVRLLPFLSKELGDYWIYVSKDKRIPVPGNLIKDGVPDKAEITAWHSRIIRMNPELKNITLQMMLNAFAVI